MKQVKRKNGNISAAKAIMIGFSIMLVVATVLIAIAATFVSGEHIIYDALDYIAPIISFVAVLFGCCFTGGMVSENKALTCVISAGAYFVIAMAAGILLFDGISGRSISGLAACIVGCIAAILVCTRNRQRSRVKNRNRPHR